MQYSRRRIQRVSGITIRDERIESRDFSVSSFENTPDVAEASQRDRSPRRRITPFDRIDTAHRERT